VGKDINLSAGLSTNKFRPPLTIMSVSQSQLSRRAHSIKIQIGSIW